MIIPINEYENGVIVGTHNINLDDYTSVINSKEDFIEMLDKYKNGRCDIIGEVFDVDFLHEIKKNIKYGYEDAKGNSQQTLKIFRLERARIIKDNQDVLNKMPFNEKLETNNKITKHFYEICDESFKYLNEHEDVFVKMLKVYINKYQDKDEEEKVIIDDNDKKESRKLINKKYYEKMKEQKGIKDRKILTEEERENYQKNYQKNHYLKTKVEKGIKDRTHLTEEERANYQKNYYLKKKEEKGIKTRTILTEEERKEYQRNYYLKKKGINVA